ncbi:MAG: hypothetical protein FWC70_00330 [Defluviitaleaceae bacterium]|nr:hypothetical protein [Defluviitaleaceae bacterium]
MSPYEIIDVAQNAPGFWQSILAIFGWGAFVFTSVYQIAKRLIYGGKKAVNKLAEKVADHEALAPLKNAADAMTELAATVQEAATGIAEMQDKLNCIEENFEKKINGIESDKRELARITLYNSLTRIYYDMRAKERFNGSMYKSFTETHALYKKYGGNGAVDGYDEDLRAWRKAEIKAGHSE